MTSQSLIYIPETGIGFFYALSAQHGHGTGGQGSRDGGGHGDAVIVAAINNAAGKAAGIYPEGTFIGLGFDAQGFQHGHNGGYPVRFFQPKPLDIAEQATGLGGCCHR